MKPFWALLLVLGFLSAVPASADIPRTLSYQGLLKDDSGAIVPDGVYAITFRLYPVGAGGAPLWEETQPIPVLGGIFNARLGASTPLGLPFDEPYWLGISVEGGAELVPRTPLASAPYAFHSAGGGGGIGGAGSPDTLALFTGETTLGNSIVLQLGETILVGGAQPRSGQTKGDGPDTTRTNSVKMQVNGSQVVVRADLNEQNADEDDRAAIYGYRTRSTRNDGSGYAHGQTNNAVVGANYWGDNYTFGVAGYSFNDYPLSGGVLGANWNGGYWGALGYRDSDDNGWGLYTPNGICVGGFRMPSGASPGYVLTCSATGAGTWQPPSGGGGGDITAVYADAGLTGGATSGDAHLQVGAGDGIDVAADAVSVDVTDFAGSGLGEDASNNLLVNTGTGLQVSGDAVALTTAYSSGSAYDSRFVNEGQANAVGTSMIQGGAVDFARLANPLVAGTSTWNWDFTSGGLDLDKTTSYPVIDVENSASTTDGDCIHLRSSSETAGTSTWLLYARTEQGKAGYFSKGNDDGEYAVHISAPDEGLYCSGDLVVASGYTKSGVVETSQGHEAIFCVESPEVEIYASGTGRLSAGRAAIRFDRLFAEAVSPGVPVRVTVTPIGGWSALYLESTEREGFVLRSDSGDPEIEFHWMACGRRSGYETRPEVTIPDVAGQAATEARKRAGRRD